MNHADDNPASDDNLNRTIRAALQVDADQPSLARLEQFWLRQSRRKRWRRRVTYALPVVAAAALAAVAFFVAIGNRQEHNERALVIHDSAPVHVDPTPSEPRLADNSVRTERMNSEGRPATPYEQFLFRVRANAPGPAVSRMAAVDVAINQLRQAPNADAKQALDAAGLNQSYAERLLLRRLSRSDDAEREFILRLLAVCGTDRSVPALLRLGQREILRDDALVTIEQIVGVEKLSEVVRYSTNPEVRWALMRRLLALDTEPALNGYLSLVRDDATSREALAVVEETPQLPITALLAALDHKDKAVRMSAAMMLGHVNDTAVTKLLIARVTEKPSDSTETWLALMVSRGELAGKFLAYATNRPQLLGHFNAARVQWGQSIP